MFPERIGKFVVDGKYLNCAWSIDLDTGVPKLIDYGHTIGVVSPDDYISGFYLAQWRLTDEAVGQFFKACHLAGPKKCAFYIGKTAADIKARAEAFI